MTRFLLHRQDNMEKTYDGKDWAHFNLNSVNFAKMKSVFLLSVMISFAACINPTPSACIGANLPEGIISMADTVSLEAGCSENGKTFHWDLGDGTKKDGFSIQHIYQKEGVFYVQLAVGNGKKSDTAVIVYSVQK